MRVNIAGEALDLLAEKALYWPREATLFVADIHFGKVAAFRAAGIALPPGSTTNALARLDRVLATTRAKRIIFLGDFLHSKAARAVQTFDKIAEWRRTNSSLSITLVRGNHDAHAGDPPLDWNIEVINEGEVIAPFCLAHHPEPDARGYVLAGHVHPAIRLQGRANDGLRLPCFWFGERVAVLPAFGEFTGTFTVTPKRGERAFVIADDVVIDVSPK
jgi:uncharacterized protein